MINRLRAAIEKKGCALGTFLGLSDPAVVEVIGYTGMDFVVIDTEHGPYDTMPMSDLIRAAEGKDMAPVVRIADVTHKEIQRAVDNGAEGVIIPYLKDIKDFRKAVELCKFPPIGSRGFMKARGAGYGGEEWAAGTLEEYMRNSNEKVLLIPQCETCEALESIEEIVSIDGIDGIFIGPFDLSISMGMPGQFDAPEMKAAIDRILNACKSAGKLCIMFCGGAADAKKYKKMGFDAISVGVDANVLMDAYRALVDEVSKQLSAAASKTRSAAGSKNGYKE